MKTKQHKKSHGLIIILTLLITISTCLAAGTLSKIGSNEQPATIQSHNVDVLINNGYARTEVYQVFRNENPKICDAIYSFPVPREASLAEVQVRHGETILNGEVVPKKQADKIYKQEKESGNKAAKAEKNSYQDFKFHVANIQPGNNVEVNFVYYQPLPLDTNTCKYVYPLEEGGTDEVATSFWTGNDNVESPVKINVTIKSAYPVAAVRTPGLTPIKKEGNPKTGDGTLSYELPAKLNQDFVLYYRLVDNQPGRLEMTTYRPNPNKPGTFMLTLTPGLDLKPLTNGSDYCFILDISGSMNGGKIKTLTDGVAKTIKKLQPQDRFKIITFNQTAHDFSRGWHNATEDNVNNFIEKVKKIQANGSTNVYAGLKEALDDLDQDRASTILLVTDGVTNTGIVKPKAFYDLMKKYDVRLFGFLMGNSGNWPLMRLICEATGGFYSAVSNSDDIVGEILKAKGKVSFQCLRDAKLEISGVNILNNNIRPIGKIFRGQQLILFGRYEKSGKANVRLTAKLTGEDKVYETDIIFPKQSNETPEIERMYALKKIEELEDKANAGLLNNKEVKSAIENYGVEYQIVTDETSMLVLDSATFQKHNIKRHNQQRVATERQSYQQQRMSTPVNRRVDQNKRMFNLPSPNIGGGGALSPFAGILFVFSTLLIGFFAKKENNTHKINRQ